MSVGPCLRLLGSRDGAQPSLTPACLSALKFRPTTLSGLRRRSAGVRAELGPLLDAALAPGSALRALDLLGAGVVEEVQGALAAALPGALARAGPVGAEWGSVPRRAAPRMFAARAARIQARPAVACSVPSSERPAPAAGPASEAGMFSPGVPPAFHANYLACAAWLSQLEALIGTAQVGVRKGVTGRQARR